MTTIGWVSAYDNSYRQAPFTDERRKALVERIKKRRYNFNHFDHEMLSYGAPFYDDQKFCILTKQQWDSVMTEAYKDSFRGARLMPEDAIERSAINGVLYEKEKFEPKVGENNA